MRRRRPSPDADRRDRVGRDVQFQRLRLSGFKSFVEATEFRIEPGLTGLVGPNGCGKSNLLEAMRWVMGANSARSLRADGMDEVIFGGSNVRAARSHAEVRLEIDNADHSAPAPFNADDVIEVTRRIDRGRGSTYRVNGAEMRARDVQLLFADASTGANSPSLVRQGQISELIAAKPANRRRILEEAAGVAGLHGRRHEADLRLSAAQANLTRLDDVIGELERTTARLRREARAADTYRRLAADIRLAEAAALLARWRDAAEALTRAEQDAAETRREAADADAAAANAATRAAETAAAAPARRQEEMVAGAVLQRLTLERDRLDREAAAAAADADRLEGEGRRLSVDRTREAELAEEAARVAEASGRVVAELDAAAAAPSILPALEAELATAEDRRAAFDRDIERAAAKAAAEAALRDEAAKAIAAESERRGLAARRLAESKTRLSRILEAVATTQREIEALATEAHRDLDAVRDRALKADAAQDAARARRDAADGELEAATAAQTAVRAAAERSADGVRRLRAEADGLDAATAAAGGADGVLARVSPQAGYAAALAAALGDDLDAGLDVAAPAHWAGRAPVTGPTWPEGVRPIAEVVTAPEALAARLDHVGVVAATDGPALARTLSVGARLVSREGDLWRWDGFVSRANAPRPAARRLEQHVRLVALRDEIAEATPAADRAAEVAAVAAARLRHAQSEVASARRDQSAAEAAMGPARNALEMAERAAAQARARRDALAQTQARLASDAQDARRDHARDGVEDANAAESLAAMQASAAPQVREDDVLQGARTAAAAARAAENQARAALDSEHRRRDSQARRREVALRETADWTRRAQAAATRCEALAGEAARVRQRQAQAQTLAAAHTAALHALGDRLAQAQARRDVAAERLTAAEATAAESDRAARACASAAGAGRERRAAAEARLEPAREAAHAAVEAIRRVAETDPQTLQSRIAAAAVALPSDPAALETHLATLTRRREALGPVNLRASEELEGLTARGETLTAERADLTGAIAKLRAGVEILNAEGRDRLIAAFAQIDASFRDLFATLFDGGRAELRLIESDDPLEAGLEIYACPPGKKLSTMSLMSGGEQALTACALIFAVFLANPSPVCVLDEVDAPLDDANVDRFCRLLDEMRRRTTTRFVAITHNPVTMSRMDRLMGVTMAERGVSQLVSVDLARAEAMSA